MAEQRRSLAEGLKPPVDVDPALAKEFVYGGEKIKPDQTNKTLEPHPIAEARDGKGQASISRVPFTTRVRTDFASALKRESLERQLKGQFPNTLQDILEEALEPWLRANGCIT
jgi:hypothetical protein